MDDAAKRKRPAVGLALGSGGARGSAHTGVLRVLEREGVEISMIAGSSIGALVGATYAAGIPTDQVEREWLQTDGARLLRTFLPTFPRAGLSSGNELRRYLFDLLGERKIEDLPIPYAAVTCDIDTGETVILDRGSLVDAVRASTAIPGVFHPLRHGERLLVDGGLVDPVPIATCRDLGADIVVAVDITPTPQPTTSSVQRAWARIGEQLQEGLAQQTWIPNSLTELLETIFPEPSAEHRPLPGLYSILNQSVAILQQEILRQKLILHPPDVLIRPDVHMSIMGYHEAADGIDRGEDAAEAALPELRKILADWAA